MTHNPIFNATDFDVKNLKRFTLIGNRLYPVME